MNDKIELTVTQQVMLRELSLTPMVSLGDIEFINLILSKGFYVWSNKDYLNKLRGKYISYLRGEDITTM